MKLVSDAGPARADHILLLNGRQTVQTHVLVDADEDDKRVFEREKHVVNDANGSGVKSSGQTAGLERDDAGNSEWKRDDLEENVLEEELEEAQHRMRVGIAAGVAFAVGTNQQDPKNNKAYHHCSGQR